MLNFEGLLMRKNRFLRKNVRFTDQKSKTRYFSTGFCFTICFSILEKHLNVEYMALLWNVGNFGNHDYPSNYIFHQFENATFKCRVLCQRTKKTTFAKICSKNSIKKQLVVPEYHTFLIVFTRTAPNVIKLNATLTTDPGKKLCTQQIVTKSDTAKKSTKQTKLQIFHAHMSSNLSLHLFANLFVPKTRVKNSWFSQSVIRFSLYSHELLET